MILLLTIAILLAALTGFGGYTMGKRDRLSRPERRELVRRRLLDDELRHQAYEHMALGDGTLAPIVVDEINKTERALEGK